MSHYENDTWQPPIHLGPGIDPTAGPNINTSAWELEPSFRMTAMLFISRWYEPGNILSGDLVVQKVDGIQQSAKTGMMCRNYQTSTRRPGKDIVR